MFRACMSEDRLRNYKSSILQGAGTTTSICTSTGGASSITATRVLSISSTRAHHRDFDACMSSNSNCNRPRLASHKFMLSLKPAGLTTSKNALGLQICPCDLCTSVLFSLVHQKQTWQPAHAVCGGWEKGSEVYLYRSK